MMTDEEQDQAEDALIAWFQSQDIEVSDALRIMLGVMQGMILALAERSTENALRARNCLVEIVSDMRVP